MIPVLFDYASPSVFESERDRALLGLAANARRPVRFHGRVQRGTFLLRVALRALGEAIWSDDTWVSDGVLLDPVITVHPDRLFFEAFSQDQSVYAMVIVDPTLFATEGEVRTGTTNVDFTAWLWGALAELRSSRETWFRIEAGGFEVKTISAGGRFEQKVELPLPWVRGFLNLQGAMAMPGTCLTVRPVDLLAALRYLRFTKAKTSPRALRYEFQPGAEPVVVLEPWEHVVRFHGVEHNYTEPRTIRTWGRRRLRLIEPLLPFADSVTIYLKGRALPSFYAVHLPGITFVLGLSGWTAQQWTGSGNFALLGKCGKEDPELLAKALALLQERFVLSAKDVATALGQDVPLATQLLVRLCRQGRAIFDVERRAFRHRELFEQPADEAALYPPDRRQEEAEALVAGGLVSIVSCGAQETRKIKRLKTPDGPITREIIYRDWHVSGSVAGHDPVNIVVNDSGRLIFGNCTCEFFKENLMNQGPCLEMLALFAASEDQRRDLPTSVAAEPEAPPAKPEADGDEAAEEETEEKPETP